MTTSMAARRAKPHQKYRLADGTRVPGVTTILGIINKPALVPWANRLGLEGIKSAEFLADAADAGTLSHRLIAAHLTGQSSDDSGFTPSQHTRAENAVASFHAWARGKAP